jgi:hypothetical protein
MKKILGMDLKDIAGKKFSTAVKEYSNNDVWVTLDYSKEKPSHIDLMVLYGNVEAKTLKRVLQTCDTNVEIYNLCSHHLAEVADVIELIQRFQKERLTISQHKDIEDIVDKIFNENQTYEKYNQVVTYMKTKHKVDVTDMPKFLIREILGL